MRECWINVYPGFVAGHPCAVLGSECPSRIEADEAALGHPFIPVEMKRLSRSLRFVGVGYRLHVRLKLPALPATDALGAGKAGEDERRSHHGA